MPSGIEQEIYDFVKDVMGGMLRPDLNSPDVTYKVFERIDTRPSFLQRYKRILVGRNVENVHQQIGKSVKDIGSRENDDINTDPPQLKNIRLTSYTRFKQL